MKNEKIKGSREQEGELNKEQGIRNKEQGTRKPERLTYPSDG